MIVYRNFEGDVRQTTVGLAADGVTFKEATTVFAAEDLVIAESPASGDLRAIGTSARGRKLVVLHRRGARIRILDVALYVEGGEDPFASRPAKTHAVEAAAEAPASVTSGAITTATSGAITTATSGAITTATTSLTRDGIAQTSTSKPSVRRTDKTGERLVKVDAIEPTARSTSERRSTNGKGSSPMPSSIATDPSVSQAPARAPVAARSVAPAASIKIKPNVPPPSAKKTAAKSPDREPAIAAQRAARQPSAPPSTPEPTVEVATSKSSAPANGWTAETYEVFWNAYSAARQEARHQGKSPREAQRLGREAGERAASRQVEPPPKQPSRQSSWRAAARSAKLAG